MNDKEGRLKEKVISICNGLYEEGLMLGSYGNASIRIGNDLIITPSAVSYSSLEPKDLVKVPVGSSLSEEHPDTEGKPSSELLLHKAIYQNRSDAGAVIHSHSPYASVYAATGNPVPVTLEEQAQIIGGRVNCTGRYIRGQYHKELASEAVETMGEANAALIRHHGIVCRGPDLDEAYLTAKVVEKGAEVGLLATLLGDLQEIPEDAVRKERKRYLTQYKRD